MNCQLDFRVASTFNVNVSILHVMPGASLEQNCCTKIAKRSPQTLTSSANFQTEMLCEKTGDSEFINLNLRRFRLLQHSFRVACLHACFMYTSLCIIFYHGTINVRNLVRYFSVH